MKRKKSPIMILTAMIVLVCLAVFFNDRSRDIAMTPEQMEKRAREDQERQMKTAKQEAMPAESKEAMAEKLKVAQGSGGAAGPGSQQQMMEEMRKNLPPEIRDRPAVARPKMKAQQPKPNDSQIAGQWWSDEHYKSGQ